MLQILLQNIFGQIKLHEARSRCKKNEYTKLWKTFEICVQIGPIEIRFIVMAHNDLHGLRMICPLDFV